MATSDAPLNVPNVTLAVARGANADPNSERLVPAISISGTNTLKLLSQSRKVDSSNITSPTPPDLSVAGALIDGESVQITTGSLNFGQGAEVYLFDDFTGTSIVGGQIASTPRLGTQTYSGITADDTLADKKRGASNSVWAVRADMDRLTSVVNLPSVRQCFHSISLFLPETSSWTGSFDGVVEYVPKARYIPADSTFKVIWYYSNNDWGTGSNLCVPTHASGDDWYISGNSTASMGGKLPFSIRESITWNGWNTMEGYLKADSASTADLGGSCWLGVTSPLYRQQNATVTGTMFSELGAFNYQQCSVMGWVDFNSLAYIYMTDLYFASNCARVVVADNADITLAKRKIICPRNGGWSATSASVLLKLGDIDLTTEAAFLFVYSDANAATPINSVGKFLNPEVLQ